MAFGNKKSVNYGCMHELVGTYSMAIINNRSVKSGCTMPMLNNQSVSNRLDAMPRLIHR